MKKFLLTILVLASVVSWRAVDASIKKASETITVDITTPLDSSGLPGAPDSIHVVAWPDNAATASYTASLTAIDGDQFDTITVGGRINYVFRDAIADIDGAGGNFELAVFVTAFYKKLPTQSPPYYVQVVSDSLENFLDAPMDSANVIIANLAKGIDSINAILDTLQLYDGRYALASELTKAIDSINAILDTLQLTDTRLDSLLAAAGHTAKVGADQIWSLRGLHIRATGDHDTAIIAQGGDINGIGFYRWGGKYGSYSYGEQYSGSYDTGFAFGAQFGGIVYDIVGDIHGTLTRTDSVGDGGVKAFWNKPYNSSFTAGSMGDSLNNNPFATILAAVNAVPLGTWNIPFTTAFTAGSMGDSLTNGSYVQGAASGLDSAIVEGAAKAALQAGIDASFGKIHATNLILTDTANDDTSAFHAYSAVDAAVTYQGGGGNNAVYEYASTGTTHAYSNGASSTNPVIQVAQNGSGDGVKLLIASGATGSGSALNLKNEAAQTTTGYSLRATSSAGKYTVYISNTSDALLGGAWWMGAEGDSASTLTLTQGSTDPNVKTVQVEGTTSFYSKYSLDQPAVLIHGVKPSTPALYIYHDSAVALRLSTSHPTYYDTAVQLGGNVSLSGNKFVGEIVGDIHGKLDTVLQANHLDTADYIKDGAITATLSGTGTYSVQLLILDTLPATDAPIIDANVTIRNLAQTNYVAWDVSDINGLTSFNLDTGQYAVLTRRAGCGFPTPDTIHVTGIMTDTVMGYNTNASKTCATSVVVYGQDGDPLKNVVVTAQLLGNNLRDSTGNPIGTWIQASKTDSTGEATFNCLWSSYIIPSTKWRFAIQSPLFGNAYKDIAIPRSTSYQVSFIK